MDPAISTFVAPVPGSVEMTYDPAPVAPANRPVPPVNVTVPAVADAGVT
jgi:hypothetical protein